jgi:uroporphyrinogen decarboxylase
MSKRDEILSLVLDGDDPGYVPAAFFLHFPEEFHEGQAAADKHMEYFRFTGMDLVKIQFEQPFPLLDTIEKADDWADMPFYDVDFYHGQIEAVKELVEAADGQALTVVTLYSAFMCAMQTSGPELVSKHLLSHPEAFCKGLEAITESLLVFVNACIDAGVDGFYSSTQGGEDFRFDNKKIFEDYIKPYDLLMWEKLEANCDFNILHVCDYHGKYSDLSTFAEYPGEIVNAPLELTTGPVSAAEITDQFGRPYMGGLDRFGVIAGGSEEDIRETVYDTLDAHPKISILGADCTLPPDTEWENIKTAIEAAHSYERSVVEEDEED